MDKEQRENIGKRNREWGLRAEQLAAEYFLKEGYTIRERNWRMGHLEVDLILEKDRKIIFVEVKARQVASQDPVLAVDRKKQQRMINAADVYLRKLKVLYQYRFDIITFIGNEEVFEMKHYQDAFIPMAKRR